MKNIIILMSIVAIALFAFAGKAMAQEQKSGQELVFPNVDQVKQRPSDVHVGSDPYYQKGVEQQMKGTDQGGYDKGKVEQDKVYQEEKTDYKVIKKGKKSAAPAPEASPQTGVAAPAPEAAPQSGGAAPSRWGQ
ncbi:MAG: hypothetical protein WC956_03465 [bacterium]